MYREEVGIEVMRKRMCFDGAGHVCLCEIFRLKSTWLVQKAATAISVHVTHPLTSHILRTKTGKSVMYCCPSSHDPNAAKVDRSSHKDPEDGMELVHHGTQDPFLAVPRGIRIHFESIAPELSDHTTSNYEPSSLKKHYAQPLCQLAV